ncbi:MAG: sulfide/dihydroorotate dehydrogenase-like FAD/NAD-binding protein [Limnochordia bacterium]|nr:sulfide/dihydroorotate dehydrogenase-like FAD/NAD-binding protein [Limnochordia bacterium]MDD2628826.1 sulfide/dihydroorotate dehydrogenase-like FAD/NAD-binding protein [Limnochordia bacterium]MDD4517407.1 sulfide/dihydroorotate dehydrogenase-like FAD/NAD-binding protein [Limnochordia bacterium]
MYLVRKSEEIGPQIQRIEVEAPLIAKKVKPGQFVVIRTDEAGERIPLTVASADQQEGTITLVVQRVGKTTKKLASLKVGEQIKDVAGPSGMPADIRYFGTVVCVSGGVGNAIIYPEAKAFKEAGNRVLTLIGARSQAHYFFTDELEKVSDEVFYATDDGSFGHQGFVTDLLSELIAQGETIDLVVAIGPIMMMRAVAKVTEAKRIKTIVSLNPLMVDGTGMCGCCRVTVDGQVKFACVDGPEFDAHKVDFDELLARNLQYAEEEKRALEHSHKGRCACHG